MEPLIGLFLLGALIVIFVLPIIAMVKSSGAQRQIEDLKSRLNETRAKLADLQVRLQNVEQERSVNLATEASRESKATAEKEPQKTSMVLADYIAARAAKKEGRSAKSAVPEAPPHAAATPPPLPARAITHAVVESSVTPRASEVRRAAPAAPKLPELTLEQFMGVKLFAWLGGLALFFGIAFFIKYSFDHDLIPPKVRVAIGFVFGTGLLVAGVIVHRKKAYTVLAQTFCASGVLILYGVSFGAHALYHLFGGDPQGPLVAFALMTLITAVAFLLAVRLNALVVAVLGMLGGFITPLLLSTGQDNPLGLFSYIAMLDIGLLMVAKRKRWLFLSSMGAAGTVLMQLGWFAKFFEKGHYYEGNATLIPMGIVIFFIALFTVAAWRSREKADSDPHLLGAALALCGFGLLTAFVFLDYPDITSRTFWLYGYMFFINIAVLAVVVIAPRFNVAQIVAGLATFLHLSIWTMVVLKPEMLTGALVVYLVFGILHAAFPIVWQRLRTDKLTAPSAFSPWFPPLIIVMMLLPVLTLDDVSFIIWPAILLADLCVIVVAFFSGVLLPVIAALVLTLVVVSAWLLNVPPQITALPSFLFLLGGFAAVFAVAGCWLAKRYPRVLRRDGVKPDANDQIAAMLPVLSAALPFLLLIMVTLRLPVLDPSPVFGLGLLLVLLLLGLAKIIRIPALVLASLGCMSALEATWHGERFDAEHPWTPLCWYAGVHLLFTAYPFVFRNTFRQNVLPWAASAISGIGHFVLIYLAVKASFHGMAGSMGLLPAVFVLPGIASVLGVLRLVKPEGDVRNAQLAWFGGVSLLFITLIFPIQFDRQWLTISWAMEGAALIWLFRRVPHRGLIGTGLVLLTLAFARLALNPAVFSYYPRGTTAILNWHLYTYGIAAFSMALAARWLPAKYERLKQINVRAVLFAFGGTLLFLLLNIEIADYFTELGARFTTISFGGTNLARDATYSMAWGLFALALLIIGFILNNKGTRYAGIGLLAVTLLKLFVHDLASLDNIYRIGALMVVAVIALLASFLYQRFFDKTNIPPKP